MTILADPMYRRFVRQITDDPADGPRLVCADYLEDQGEADRARFIRKQIEWANWKRYEPPPEIEEIANSDRLYARQATQMIAEMRETNSQQKCDLQDEIEILLTRHGQEWTLEMIPDGAHPFWPNADRWMTGCVARRKPGDNVNLSWAVPGPLFWWRRGFVEKVRMPWAQWRERADELLAVQPVAEVMIVGAIPLTLIPWPSRFVRPDADRTWRAVKETVTLPFDAGPFAICQALFRKEWPSVKKWVAGDFDPNLPVELRLQGR